MSSSAQTDRTFLAGEAKNATAKVKGFGASLRYLAMAAAFSSTRSPGFNAGREPRARRYFLSREWSQTSANFFRGFATIGQRHV
jgi:hypothetical protein